jgi:8-oxo-dGTP diphosphatase
MPTATLCHILKNSRLLLQKKSKGLFGAGKWNGVGGKCFPDETPETCVSREVYEETGLSVANIQYHGVLTFTFDIRGSDTLVVHVFSTRDFDGSIQANDEGILRWFAFDDIPYQSMWLDDQYWLPLMLAGKRFQGVFHFNQEGTAIRDWELREVASAHV